MKKTVTTLCVAMLVLAGWIALRAQCTVTLPSIVYTNAWTGQTSNIGSTTIFTPSANGLFRANIALHGTGGIEVIADFSDAFCVAHFGGANNPGCVHVFEGLSGTPITIDTRILTSGTSYDLYVTLEQLH